MGGGGARRETETPRAAPLPWVPAFAGTTVGGRVKGRALSLNGIIYIPVCKRCLAGNTGRKVLIGDYMMGMR